MSVLPIDITMIAEGRSNATFPLFSAVHFPPSIPYRGHAWDPLGSWVELCGGRAAESI